MTQVLKHDYGKGKVSLIQIRAAIKAVKAANAAEQGSTGKKGSKSGKGE